MFILGSLEST